MIRKHLNVTFVLRVAISYICYISLTFLTNVLIFFIEILMFALVIHSVS